jgi:hypothetical protein
LITKDNKDGTQFFLDSITENISSLASFKSQVLILLQDSADHISSIETLNKEIVDLNLDVDRLSVLSKNAIAKIDSDSAALVLDSLKDLF